LAALLALAALAGCKQFSFFSTLGDRLHDTPLSISPAAVTVPLNGTSTFTATGGQPPYSYSVASGTGTIDAGTGLYTAPGTACTETVRVTDNAGGHSDATVYVTNSSGPLTISPTTVTMGPGGSLTFVASGGSGGYSFSLVLPTGTGSPSINPSTGAYTAGVSIGTDTVRAQDSLGVTADATVTVTEAVTGVDYMVSATNFPTTAAGGSTILATDGYTFTIQNVGGAGGTKSVSWWIYLSDDGTLGSGDSLLSRGSTGFLASMGSVVIPLTASLPLTSGPKQLFVMVSAADDLTVGNNTSAGDPLTLSPPDINYTVLLADITYTAPPVPPPAPGTAIGGGATFRITNTGTLDGSQTVSWAVYVSTDETVDAADILIASGATALPLAAGAKSPAIPCGTWPLGYGNYYLLFQVSSPEDFDASDDTRSIGFITPVGIYQAIVQNGDCNNLTNYTDLTPDLLTGVVLKPGMSVMVRSTGFPAGHLDHLFRLHTGTASTLTASWVLDSGLQDIGVFYYWPPGGVGCYDGYWQASHNSIGLTITIEASAYRWIDLYNPSLVDLGSYTLYITAY
jgi:hypothetical protein